MAGLRISNGHIIARHHHRQQMPSLEEEIAHLRERAAQFVALAKQHLGNDRVRQRLMTVAADLYTKAADLEQKLKRGAA